MPLDPLDYYDNLPGVVTLMAWTMRGHYPAPNPVTLTPESLSREIALRSQVHPERRYVSTELGHVIEGIIHGLSTRRGLGCQDVIVGKTCVYAAISFSRGPGGESSFHDAVRLITTRRARRQIAWPRSERVFAPRHLWWPFGLEEEACMDLRLWRNELRNL